MTSLYMMIFNLVSFQAIWWLGVLWGNIYLWLSSLLLLGHFVLSKHKMRDLRVMWFVSLIGISVDAALIFSGFFIFSSTPVWLMVLWGIFAISLQYSLGFLSRLSVYLQAIFGGVFGTISYLAGYKFGAVELGYSMTNSVIALILIWSILLPVLIAIANMSAVNRGQDDQSITQ
ncbi:DUF2878 domain-containing protein [Shewanella sp. WXL01]|uniref:DUF2878 domain-containing protein n=1 Tax=Shewanella sp. WXL01 TaxID=2709721 RepID=UPI001438369E|nr:DUF2878 domain-containing protein [Shewanella sp. WXL01]NKF49822.1 DUF2878 domain-containing protein [Shewanella sp. WXL01]